MGQIYYTDLDIDVENDIKNTKSNLATHETKVASSTESGHIKIDDLTLKLNQDGQLYSTLNAQDITTLVEYHQYVLPTTSIGQKSWEIPLATFDPTKDLIIVTHNTTILSDSMYTITSLGNLYSLNITEQIPEAIASNNVFIIILKGKAESPTVPTDLSVDNVTIIKEDNMLKAVNVKGLSVPTQNINEYLTGTESNIQQQINNMQISLNNMVSGVEYLGRFESYAELNSIAIKYNGDMAVVLTDETKDGGRTLYIYNEPLAMWQFVGAFNIGGGSQFSDNFLELLDTPNNYTGASGKNVSVNIAGTGLEFTDIDYNNIINKPTSTTIAIDNAVTDSHTHANKSDLDRLGINMSDRLTIDGVDFVVDAIGSAVDSAKSYVDNQLATHDSKDATTTSKGHVQIGSGLSVTNGIVSVTPTTVADATKTSKGQVQVGNGLSVTSGVISVDATPDATTTTKGVVQIGSGLNIQNGIVSSPSATTTTKGIIQVGDGLNVLDGIVSIPNASKTVKGHMQVGEGLDVIDGVVSVNRSVDTSFSPSTPAKDFPIGTTETAVVTNSSNSVYVQFRDIVSSLMGYGITTGTPFKFYMKTSKRSDILVRQEVIVASNYAENVGVELFSIQRDTKFSDGTWYPWHINVSTITGTGNPNGVVTGFKGCLYMDANTTTLYKKTTGTTTGLNSGWVALDEASTATVTRASTFSGTFTSKVTKQGIFTRLELKFINPSGTTVNSGTEVIIGNIPDGYRPTGEAAKVFVGDNTGTRTPRHAIIIYTDGRIGWTPSVSAGNWTMQCSVVY